MKECSNCGNNYPDNFNFCLKCKPPVKLSPVQSSAPVDSVELDKYTLTLQVNQSEKLTATVKPNNATNNKVGWTSDNTTVAKVKNGVVTAMKSGIAVITATSTDGSNESADCTVTVKRAFPKKMFFLALLFGIIVFIIAMIVSKNSNSVLKPPVIENSTTVPEPAIEKESIPPTISPTSVSLDKTSLSLAIGGTGRLNETITPNDATNKTVTWSSSNSAIATVNAQGLITAKTEGSATITVTTADGNKTASCTVTVKSDKDKTYPFGKYKGKLVNGIPQDPQGTMDYTRRVQIAKHGSKTIYAESGDKFVGAWYNGDIEHGRLLDGSGNVKETIHAGRRPSPYRIDND